MVELITSEQDFAHSGGFDELEFHSNHDPVWSIFAGVVKNYREFDLLREDIEWFRQRVIENSSWQSLNLMEEIKNWGDWLNIEHRKKCGKKENKFPLSNFKGSLMNWLKQSLKVAEKGQTNVAVSNNQETQGRKGWDLPSDYRIDIM